MSKYDWKRFNEELRHTVYSSLDCRELVRAQTRGPMRKWMAISCPSPEHIDSNPSCHVGRTSVSCKSCGFKGNVFALIGALHDLESFGDQLSKGLELLGLSYEEEASRYMSLVNAQDDWAPASPTLEELVAQEAPLLEEAPGFPDPSPVYTFLFGQLGMDKKGRRYLQGRGLNPDVAFGAGVRATTHGMLVKAVKAARQRFGDQAVEDSGVVFEGSVRPSMSHMLVFGYRDEMGRVQALRFRRTAPCPKQRRYASTYNHTTMLPFLGTKRGRALTSARQDVLFVCEGEPDALSLASLGLAVVGMPGAASWKRRWCESWSTYERVVVLLDADASTLAGSALQNSMSRDVVARHGQAFLDERVTFHRIDAPDCKDSNDLAQQNGLQSYIEEVFHV